jgi:hypothetical protein
VRSRSTPRAGGIVDDPLVHFRRSAGSTRCRSRATYSLRARITSRPSMPLTLQIAHSLFSNVPAELGLALLGVTVADMMSTAPLQRPPPA